MTSQFFIFVAVSIGLIAVSTCYPTGAPQETCKIFTANHTGHSGQNSVSKYIIKINPSALSSGSKATVTIEGDIFKGFFIQAEDVRTKEPIGKFKPKAGVSQTRDCNGPNSATAATHVDNNDKSKVELDWESPASYKGEIIYRAVIVKTYEIFWDNVRSNSFTIA